MGKRIFREKSMEKLRSPEQLEEYLHITNPGLWLVLIAILVLTIGFFVWAGLTPVESYVYGNAEVKDQVLTFIPEEDEDASWLDTGLSVAVGEQRDKILSLGRDAEGRVLAVAKTLLPDGVYEARVGYRTTRVIRMLFE